jgi:predicted metal-binding protein
MKLHAAICDGDVKMSSVAYVNGFFGRHLLCNGSCDACKACLISEAQSPTDVYIGFKECSNTVHSLTYPIEKLVETVGTGVTVVEGMMLEGLT